MDVTILVFIAISIVAHLILCGVAVRMVAARKDKWPFAALAVMGLGLVLLQRVLAFAEALGQLRQGGAHLMAADVMAEAVFALLLLFLLWLAWRVAKSVAAGPPLASPEPERLRMAQALSDIASILTSTLDLDLVLKLVLDCLGSIVDYDSSAIFLRHDDRLVLTAGQGFPEGAEIEGFSLDIADSALDSVLLQEGRPVVIADVQQVELFRSAPGHTAIRSWIGAPLWARGRLIGLLTVDHSLPDRYAQTDAKNVMDFANQAAIVIDNACLFEGQVRLARELESQNEELIETQHKLIEAERLAVIGQVGLTVRHEINNPLTTVLGLAQWLLSEYRNLPPEVSDDLRTIERMAGRIRDIIDKLEAAEYRTITYTHDITILDLHGQGDIEDVSASAQGPSPPSIG